MGSGLILLLIVGAWLAVLVPMALRSHEASAVATVDKFSDAMRVLSRRDRAGRADVAEASAGGEAEPDAEPDAEPVGPARAGRVARVRARLGRLVRRPRRRGRVGRRPLTPARRRLRALLVLLVLTAATLAGALLGPVWMLVPHLVVDALLVVFLCWLRASAAARAEREWRRALGGSSVDRDSGPILPVEVPEQAPPTWVAGIPDRLPSRASLDPRPERLLPAPRTADAPARGAQGEPWEPVPVPVPTYVNAPRAPRRWDAALSPSGAPATRPEPTWGDESDRELDHVLGRRRAVGD